MKQVKYIDTFLTEMVQIAENIYDRHAHLEHRNSIGGEMRIRGQALFFFLLLCVGSFNHGSNHCNQKCT